MLLQKLHKFCNMDLWSSYLLLILNWVLNSFNKSKSIIQIMLIQKWHKISYIMLPFQKPMPMRSANGSKYGMITKTWKKKAFFPTIPLKGNDALDLWCNKWTWWNHVFCWFQITIVFSFSLLVFWTFQLRKLFIDSVALKTLYWPTSSLSCNSWWPSHCCRIWSIKEHGWIHSQMETCPFSKCTLPRVQWQRKPFLSW